MEIAHARDDRNILGLANTVGDHDRAGIGVERRAPQELAIAVVEGLQGGIEIANENHAAGGGQGRRGDRRIEVVTPGELAAADIHGLQAPHFSVCNSIRMVCVRDLGPGGAQERRALRSHLRAPLCQRQVELTRRLTEGCRRPGARARRAWAVDRRARRIGKALRIDRLRAGLRIDGRDDVLRAGVDREQIGAGGGIEGLEYPHLADIHHDLAGLAADSDCRQRPLECPVEVPLVVGQVLIIPLQLSGIGVQRDGGVGEERIVGDAGKRRGVTKLGGVVGCPGAVIDQIELGVVRALVPDRAAGALVERYVVPGVAARLTRPGERMETP